MTAADGPLRKFRTVDGGKKLSRLPVASALRTLDLECEGLNRLREALTGPMSRAFGDALRILRAPAAGSSSPASARAATSARRSPPPSPRRARPAFFVHPTEASHGDLGMITPDDVLLALSWSGETVELKPLITYSRRYQRAADRHHLARRFRPRPALRHRAGAAAHEGGLPARPRADHLDHHAARARRLPRRRAARGQGLHAAGVQGVPSRRLARRQPEVRVRRHAQGRAHAASRATPSR